jgi:hypothetical protein
VKEIAVTVEICVLSRAATATQRSAAQRNEDGRMMNHLVAGFIVDRGSFRRDVVS